MCAAAKLETTMEMSKRTQRGLRIDYEADSAIAQILSEQISGSL